RSGVFGAGRRWGCGVRLSQFKVGHEPVVVEGETGTPRRERGGLAVEREAARAGGVLAIHVRVEEHDQVSVLDLPLPVTSGPDTAEARRAVAEATLGERHVNGLGRQQGVTQRE